ncbi:hypothetical protein [Cohnella sp. GCM10027633]|uniref:hypothetical protein n=1 Tax=unclassified Cohnella TaxID=2636738 RepID=UPI00362CC5C2
MKRWSMCVLVLLLYVTGIPNLQVRHAQAANNPNDQYTYRTGAWVEDGKVVFVARNKKATANIRYGTKAFFI